MNGRHTRQRQGVTLLEVVVALVVLGVLALIVQPSYAYLKDQVHDRRALTELRALHDKAAPTSLLQNNGSYNFTRAVFDFDDDLWEESSPTGSDDPLTLVAEGGSSETPGQVAVGLSVHEPDRVGLAQRSQSGRCVVLFAEKNNEVSWAAVDAPVGECGFAAENWLDDVVDIDFYPPGFDDTGIWNTAPTTTTGGPTTTTGGPTTTTTPPEDDLLFTLPAPVDPWTGNRVDIFAFFGNIVAGAADPTDFSLPYLSPARTGVAVPVTQNTNAEATSQAGIVDNNDDTGPGQLLIQDANSNYWSLNGSGRAGTGTAVFDFANGAAGWDYTVSPDVAHLSWENYNPGTRIEASAASDCYSSTTGWTTLWTAPSAPGWDSGHWNVKKLTDAALDTDTDDNGVVDQWRCVRINHSTANSVYGQSNLTRFNVFELQLFGTVQRTLLPTPTPAPGVTNLTFDYTGNVHTFIVPAGVTSLTVTATGASGGCSAGDEPVTGGNLGGNGGVVSSTLSVTPGQRLYLHVGARGTNSDDRSLLYSNDDLPCRGAQFDFTDGWNGGGYRPQLSESGGGGGATDIRLGGYDVDDRILVAGGGGGAGQWYNWAAGASGVLRAFGGDGATGSGPNPGYGTAGDGDTTQVGSPWVTGGGGGTWTAGGSAGLTDVPASLSNGAVGTFGVGAPGIHDDLDSLVSSGAGGGGYYGGGSGAVGRNTGYDIASAGGGGSSWADPARATATSYSVNSTYPAHGSITITYTA